MKIIERSEFRDEEGAISLENRIRGSFRHGLKWYGWMQAQETTTQRLEKCLDREHTLLRNVIIPGTTVIVQMILLSPQGVRVLEPSPIKGVYRAKGEEWLKFDSRGRRFKRSQPNLQTRTLNNAQVVQRYLKEQGYPLPEVEAVLIFTKPRTHVDSARPRVRIVQADAIDHFAANIQEFQPIMDQEDIDALTEALINPKLPEPEPTPEPEAEPELARAEFLEQGETLTTELEPMALPAQAAHRLSTLPLSTRQWILLAMMLFFELVIIIIFAMLIIRNTIYA